MTLKVEKPDLEGIIARASKVPFIERWTTYPTLGCAVLASGGEEFLEFPLNGETWNGPLGQTAEYLAACSPEKISAMAEELLLLRRLTKEALMWVGAEDPLSVYECLKDMEKGVSHDRPRSDSQRST